MPTVMPVFQEPKAILFRVHMYDLYDHSDRVHYTTWADDQYEAVNTAYANVESRYILDYVEQIWPKRKRVEDDD